MSPMSRVLEGKLPLKVLEPILEAIPQGRLVNPIKRIGMDAAILGSSGKYVVIVSGLARGSKRDLGSKLVSQLSEKMRMVGVTPSIIDPIILFPNGTSMREARMVISEINNAASLYGTTVAKGHTEITPWLDKITIIVTLIGTSRRRPCERKN